MRLFILVILFSSLVFSQTCDPACQNGGECLAGNACNCNTDTTGWSGPTCETALCDGGGCGPGTCVKPNQCDCTGTGWTGPRCNVGVCSSPCLHNGNCTGPDTCSCHKGQWAGQFCEVPVCDPVCKAGTCIAPNTCNCTGTGFKGALCDQFTCETPCVHGTCTGPNLCNCANTSYVGSLCEIPVCTPACLNGGTCTSPGKCSCAKGWKGDICETPICDKINCLNGGNCSGPNVCDCRGTGYIGDTCTIDVNECQATPPVCDVKTSCTNINGSYLCSDCPTGWKGNGKEPCVAVCVNNCGFGNCTAPNVCTCDRGYTGDSCNKDLNECVVGGYCSPLVNCTNTIGSYICGPCPGNYTGDGSQCNPVCEPPCGDGLYCAKPFVCEKSSGEMLMWSAMVVIVLNLIVIFM